MDALFLAFSNSKEAPLQTLTDEYKAINEILAPRKDLQHFQAELLMHATPDDVLIHLTRFKERLILFQYSGHAGRDRLFTEEGVSNIEGIAHLLGQCPNLKVVILNGCSTYGQVKVLHELGVPLVIATSAPVRDPVATIFSKQLHRSLAARDTIGGALEMAIGAVKAKIPDVNIHRSILGLEYNDHLTPLWGIFPHPAHQSMDDWRLPEPTGRERERSGFQPNETLLETLYKSFATTNDSVKALLAAGASLEMQRADIIEAVLKGMPAPISEQVRKLVAESLPGENGYDKIGAKRLSQLIQTYQFTMDFWVLIMFAQVWEIQLTGDWEADEKLRAAIGEFVNTTLEQRKGYDYFNLLKVLNDGVPIDHKALFIKEVDSLRQHFFQNKKVEDACFSLMTLHRQLPISGHQHFIGFCEQAESDLATLYGELSFLASYTLATVRNINIKKHRHETQASFEHLILKWHGIQGNYNRFPLHEKYFMDNRCVVLFREGGKKDEKVFLNLSPFILDKNTFEATPSLTLANLYFFAYRKGVQLFYKWVNDPQDRILGIINLDDDEFHLRKEKGTRFQPAKDLFNVFLMHVVENQKNVES